MLKRKIALILVVVLMITAFPAMAVEVSAAGAGASSSAGASEKQYAETVEITVDSANFSRSFYLALAEAKSNASSSVQYKIIIPAGNYTSTHLYRIPSNTYIYARGATISLADKSRSTLLVSGESGPTKNIIIDGGTWSTLAQPKNCKADSSVIRMMGVDNVILRNMTVLTRRRGHILEVADIDGLTVTGCTFAGNNLDSSNSPASVQPKEALQLDVALKSAMVNFWPGGGSKYNGKGCHDVLISGNVFKNCARGVGSHNGGKGAESRPYTDIAVKNNKFQNLLGEAVFAENWRNCTVSGNKINKCRQCGIYMLSASKSRIEKNQITDVRRYTGARKRTYDSSGSYGVGILIRRSSGNSIKSNKVTKYYRKTVLLEGSGKNTVKSNKGTGKRK